MDEAEREAIRAEGLDPDDPAVVTAIAFVRWELSMLGRSGHGRREDLWDIDTRAPALFADRIGTDRELPGNTARVSNTRFDGYT
jgi:hypothetical protein